jgi:hypothetical protein
MPDETPTKIQDLANSLLRVTLPEASRITGYPVQKLWDLVRTGSLTAINTAVNPHGRPRYRIALSEIARWERERATKPPTPPVRRRGRAKAATAGKEWF